MSAKKNSPLSTDAAATPPNVPGSPEPPRLVRCPACGGPSVYGSQNPWRPFCSERCKQIDMGAWADESFRMPTEAPPDDAPHGDPRQQD